MNSEKNRRRRSQKSKCTRQQPSHSLQLSYLPSHGLSETVCSLFCAWNSPNSKQERNFGGHGFWRRSRDQKLSSPVNDGAAALQSAYTHLRQEKKAVLKRSQNLTGTLAYAKTWCLSHLERGKSGRTELSFQRQQLPAGDRSSRSSDSPTLNLSLCASLAPPPNLKKLRDEIIIVENVVSLPVDGGVS